MVTKFSSHEVPDLFYVNADYAPDWIDQGFLEPLDDYIAKSGLRHEPVLPGYLRSSRVTTARSTACPRTATPSRWPTTPTWSTAAPTTMDELVTAAKALKGTDDLKAPMCLNPGLDRGLAFIYAQGG